MVVPPDKNSLQQFYARHDCYHWQIEEAPYNISYDNCTGRYIHIDHHSGEPAYYIRHRRLKEVVEETKEICKELMTGVDKEIEQNERKRLLRRLSTFVSGLMAIYSIVAITLCIVFWVI